MADVAFSAVGLLIALVIVSAGLARFRLGNRQLAVLASTWTFIILLGWIVAEQAPRWLAGHFT